MNRTDRLLAIVLELQGKGAQRAADLAATFEVSTRTLYRDMQALCEAGVPVVAVPGQGYSLVEGYFLPPLRFSTDEATLLLLGCAVMAQHFDAEYQVAAQAAARKILGVLPEDRRAVVRQLQDGIRFVIADPVPSAEAERLQLLRGAVVTSQSVSFRYHARYSADAPRAPRTVDPYGLAHVSGAWYLVGYCHMRKALRHFRVARMDALHSLPQRFARPPDFTMQQPAVDESRTLTVRALFAPEAARWVREAPSFYTVQQEQRADGLLVTLRVRDEQEVLQWLLSWGRHVRVLEPLSLRQRLLAEATAMLAVADSALLPSDRNRS